MGRRPLCTLYPGFPVEIALNVHLAQCMLIQWLLCTALWCCSNGHVRACFCHGLLWLEADAVSSEVCLKGIFVLFNGLSARSYLYHPARSRKLRILLFLIPKIWPTSPIKRCRCLNGFIPYVWAKYLLALKFTNGEAVCKKHHCGSKTLSSLKWLPFSLGLELGSPALWNAISSRTGTFKFLTWKFFLDWGKVFSVYSVWVIQKQ